MRSTAPLLLLCSSLLLAFGQTAAAESRHMNANGEGTCADAGTPANERIDNAEEADPAPARRTAPQKSKPTATPRTGNPRATPRWHSFLPGMIR